MKNDRISVLIGYTGFFTSEENRVVTLLTTWQPSQNIKRKEEKSFRLNNEEIYTSIFFQTSIFCPNNLYICIAMA